MIISARGWTGQILSQTANTETKQYLRGEPKVTIVSYDIELLVQKNGIKTITMENLINNEITVIIK